MKKQITKEDNNFKHIFDLKLPTWCIRRILSYFSPNNFNNTFVFKIKAPQVILNNG
jgi:hypothetical protein